MRRRARSLGGRALLLLAVALAGAQPAPKPDPYRLQAEPFIGPAAVPVMEQVFWVQLNQPPGGLIKVRCPEGVRLLDQTKPGPNRPFTRLYFRSDRGVRNSGLVLAMPDGRQLTVPLRVFTYREDIEDKVKDTPQLDRAARKLGRSYYTPERLRMARENLRKSPELGENLKSPSFFEPMTDEQVFSFLPSWNLPRQCYSAWPCPSCGEKIYEKSAFYPWQHAARGTFKAVCPLCRKAFPTNDITRDDFTSGDYPDDGWGFDPTGRRDRKQIAGWVGFHNHHAMWQSTGAELKRLGERYLLLDDEPAAHKAALLLARLAYVYPGMDMTWQQVQTNYLRPGRLLLDGNWERTGLTVPAAQAYDAIFDYPRPRHGTGQVPAGQGPRHPVARRCEGADRHLSDPALRLGLDQQPALRRQPGRPRARCRLHRRLRQHGRAVRRLDREAVHQVVQQRPGQGRLR